MRIELIILTAGVLLDGIAAQSLFLPPGPAAPGSTVNAVLFPAVGGTVNLNGTSLFMLTSDGNLVWPRFFQGQTLWLSSTTPLSTTLQIPATGPGSSGSFVAYHQHPPGLAARLDVGTPSSFFPALHTFPEGIHYGFGSHAPWSTGLPSTWAFVNTSASPHTFATGDLIQVFPPGGTVPLLSLPLAGLIVPAGGKLGIPLLNTLTPGPMTVDVAWLDPIVGPLTRRIGVHADLYSDLHLPGGRTLPLGGTIPAIVQFNTTGLGGGPLPSCALLVGFQPGTTTLPGGAILPLVPDALVLASLSGGLAPFLSNSPALATGIPSPACTGYCAPGGNFGTIGNAGITLSHPGPALSGTLLRVAGLLASPTSGLWRATQADEILLQ